MDQENKDQVEEIVGSMHLVLPLGGAVLSFMLIFIAMVVA